MPNLFEHCWGAAYLRRKATIVQAEHNANFIWALLRRSLPSPQGNDSASRAQCQIYLSIVEAQPTFAARQRYKTFFFCRKQTSAKVAPIDGNARLLSLTQVECCPPCTKYARPASAASSRSMAWKCSYNYFWLKMQLSPYSVRLYNIKVVLLQRRKYSRLWNI